MDNGNLEYIKKNGLSWDDCFRQAILATRLLFPVTYSSNGDEYIDYRLNDDALRVELQEMCGFDLGGWIIGQLRLYKAGKLPAVRIKKLQSLGFIEERGQFSENDYETYRNFCNQFDDKVRFRSVDYREVPIINQLFFVKRYVDKYYFYRDGQNYTLEDYISECIVGLINARDSYSDDKGNYGNYVERMISKNLIEHFDYGVSMNAEDMDNYVTDEILLEDEAIGNMMYSLVANKVISLFNNSEKIVWQYRIVEGMTLDKVSKMLNVSRERIRAIEKNIFKKFRLNGSVVKLRGDLPRDYVVHSKYNESQLEILNKLDRDKEVLQRQVFISNDKNGIIRKLFEDNFLYKKCVQEYFESGYSSDWDALLRCFQYLNRDLSSDWSVGAKNYIEFVLADICSRMNSSKVR